ncbi:prepilin-type N-terminal cleavage/methylation domain-containing protein [Halomonas sp. CH40]
MKVRQSGFSLIEALVALVVLSIGLLGAAALQINALHSAVSGYQNALVSVAAMDAQQRIWKLRAAADDCEIDPTDEKESWKTQWFSDAVENPLRNISDTDTDITLEEGDCQFKIQIVLPAEGDQNPEPLIYTFEVLNVWSGEAAENEES